MEIDVALNQLAIITLNYNSYDKTKNQIDRLIEQGIPINCFYIVDNVSEDREILKSFCTEKNLLFIQNDINGGYAHGNNIAIKKALEEDKHYFLLLNPDIEISAFTITQLLQTIKKNDTIGIIGPRIIDKYDRSLIFSDGGLLFPEKAFTGDHVHYEKTIQEFPSFGLNYDIDYVNGSAMLFTSKTIEINGYMNEDFFMYYEESEWCYRLKTQSNFKLAIDTDVVAYHEMSDKGSFYQYYMTRNQIWLTRMYNGDKNYLIKNSWTLVRRAIKKLNFNIIKAVYHGWTKKIN